jgi:ABC-type sugar transport system ATPase subunit
MADDLVVELAGVSKGYPGVQALKGVNFSLRAGHVTALAGENGAGKSTLIKVLSGAVRPDDGEARLMGHRLPNEPGEAIRDGISTIYQELTDVPDMTVLDNLLLGRVHSRFGIISTRAARSAASAALGRVGLGWLDVTRPVRTLSMAQRQLVEIARCLTRHAKVLIFDEPTSSLPEADVENLHDIIRQLRAEGLAILYVSHHLAEFFEIADEIVVMRDGSIVAEGPVAEWDMERLVRSMLARDLDEAYPWTPRELGETVLEVTDLTAPGVDHARLHARSGEVVGLIGLDGAGRTELMKTIAGAQRASRGTVSVRGHRTRPGSIRSARKAGIVYAPEDRKQEGLLLQAPIRDNLVYGLYSWIARLGFVSSRRQSTLAATYMDRFGVRAESQDKAVGTLSGGNQQKVVLARVAGNNPQVILLDDPTRGVDVGAKYGIYEKALEQVLDGAAVLLTSSDMDEVLAMADRVYVLRKGSISDEIERADFDREAILAAASTD